MRSKISAVIACIIVVLLLSFTAYAEQSTTKIIAYNLNESGAESVQEWIDITLSKNAGTGAVWYAITLGKIGDYDFSAYRTALEAYVKNNDIRSATSHQKYALALLAVGSDADYISETMENSIGEQGLMSYVYGLHLLNNGCTSTKHTAESVTEQILSMQLSDGGWAVMGEYGDPDVTAMTIQALAVCYGVNESVTTAVDKAVQFLSDKQLESGGYKSMGKEASESVSQVIVALCSLGIDTETDSRFIKNGNTLFGALEQFRLDNGSYCHEIGGENNYTSTVQAFMAYAAYAEKINLFIIDNKSEAEEMPLETVESIVTKAEENEVTVEKKISYKPLACLIITGVTVGVCVILWFTKKRNIKNFIAVVIIGAAAVIIVLCTEFSSAEYYYGTVSEKTNPIGTVMLEIRCDTVAGKADYIPENGVILAETEYAFEEGETVYDILVEACRENEIHTEFSGGYISGMNYIYEFDFGELSGWMYFVNGEEASVGCDTYKLADGDRIEWIYSLEMGNDLK